MYELRQLKSDDIFLVSAILSKIGFKDIKKSINPEELFNGENTTVLGFNIVMEVAEAVLKNLPACKTELYAFLSSVSGIEDISELSMSEFAELLVEVIQKDDFKDFFGAVAKLFK